MGTTEFAMAELLFNYSKVENNKAPGPDTITAEQLTCLGDSNLKLLLALVNRWWEEGIIDEELELANIISLFKKGTRPKSQTIDQSRFII